MGSFNHPLQSLPFLRCAPTMPSSISPPLPEFGDGFNFLSYVSLRSKSLLCGLSVLILHSIYIAPRPAFKSDIAISLSKIWDLQVKKSKNILTSQRQLYEKTALSTPTIATHTTLIMQSCGSWFIHKHICTSSKLTQPPPIHLLCVQFSTNGFIQCE